MIQNPLKKYHTSCILFQSQSSIKSNNYHLTIKKLIPGNTEKDAIKLVSAMFHLFFNVIIVVYSY